MRTIILPLAVLGTVAACAANEPTPVDLSPPAISYRLNGDDVAAANVKATDYCGQYGLAPQLQAVEPRGSGKVAHYTCAGTASGGYSYGTARRAPVKCADWLHQSRPGGSDYDGPPVPECMK